MSTATFNRHWSRVILQSLYQQGVRHVCIAPGSRSTPLTLEAANHQALTCHTHFDERGLGFYALGLAKAIQQPIAVIVTSGTAVANLYPAIVEANLTGERLIMLTADRPPELIACGANQAIQQQGIFTSHVTVALNLPRPTEAIPAAWLAATIDEGFHRLTHGVMHINCPFAEPLYGNEETCRESGKWLAPLDAWWHADHPWVESSEAELTLHPLADWPLWQQKRGIIIAGRLNAQEGSAVRQWAETLGWPLLADVLSSTGQPYAHANLWLNHPLAQQTLRDAEIVIHFGSNPVGKALLTLLANVQSQTYWSISSTPSQRIDSHNHRGRRIIAPIIAWLNAHPVAMPHRWATALLPLINHTRQVITTQLHSTFNEAAIAAGLPQLLPKSGQLFIGNSLMIRLIDAFTSLPIGYPVYSNRGASGIDGLIATTAGLINNGLPTLAVIGDLSALYDLNSLALLSTVTTPTILLIINNNGGSIFSLLPTPEAQRDQYYRMPHNLTFRHAAEMFNLRYYEATDWHSIMTRVSKHWQHSGVLIIEARVDSQTGARLLQQLTQYCSTERMLDPNNDLMINRDTNKSG